MGVLLQASARMYTCAAVHLRMFPTRTTHAHPMHRCACTDEPLHARHTPVHMHRCDYTDLSLLQRHIHVHMLMYACVCTDMPRHMIHTYTYAPTSMQWHVSTHMCCYMRAACMYSSTGTHARMRPARTTHAWSMLRCACADVLPHTPHMHIHMHKFAFTNVLLHAHPAHTSMHRP